jgi:proteasome lid subunit RPN8/RPN11
MKNIAASSAEYEMDPAELIVALREIRQTGETLIAIFHSHPHGPAEPSATDIQRAYYPEAAHLIVSLSELERPQAAAFRIVDREALAVELHVIV